MRRPASPTPLSREYAACSHEQASLLHERLGAARHYSLSAQRWFLLAPDESAPHGGTDTTRSTGGADHATHSAARTRSRNPRLVRVSPRDSTAVERARERSWRTARESSP